MRLSSTAIRHAVSGSWSKRRLCYSALKLMASHSLCLFWLWLVVKSVFINPLQHPSSITFTFVVAITYVASVKESRQLKILGVFVQLSEKPSSSGIKIIKSQESSNSDISSSKQNYSSIGFLDHSIHRASSLSYSSVLISSASSSQRRGPRLIPVCKSRILNHIRHPPARRVLDWQSNWDPI